MNKWSIAFLFAGWGLQCSAREPFKPADGTVPYLVYFPSRYRGLCVGSLVARTVVLTAAVCVTNPLATIKDTRPINVITGSTYRHPRRGIRVQVTKILIPNLSNITGNRGYLMEKSVAILLLKRKVPDVLAEFPLRSIRVDWRGEEALALQEECFMPGWHFFYDGDIIYPVMKFLLQRNVRVQFLNIVKKTLWCEALAFKFRKALSNLGFTGLIDATGSVCVRDGSYGSPLICHGKLVGLMLAPDAQWSNCTGFTNLIHLVSSDWLREFMECVSSLFVEEEDPQDWTNMKKAMYKDSDEEYDYLPPIYDRLYSNSETDSSADDF